MNFEAIFNALLGGVLIGIAVSVMLLMAGRITGISGITNGLLSFQKGDMLWRFLFILGLILSGILFYARDPQTITTLNIPGWKIMLAGLWVGFGTVMGSGCTSGHGVCGISRASPRSIFATICFIVSGMVTVALLKHVWGN